ncbi:MAG: anthranilate phosphoribosyltransferase [Sneathiella sp.]|jgi:anthranilate phosphoribosyltransferase|uniref:anthranilate phosphoribosyltransferase n=1 Tax=Sneathiella sp. TaxID=1964365 RepID=UPI000C584F5D|nr:anthranilate phosphoribosyltransferase [Sneathiella sp.]MAL79686.1 anthranilate phosphoribosyltransferase [Sneathiella sp.]
MSTVQPDFKALIAKIATGKTLSVEEAKIAFNIILSGDATPSQMGAFLMGLHLRGETVDELIGGVSVLREKATYITAPENAVDVVGTGGDGHGTLNISTAAAFVTAGAGVPVAKHGNKAASSRSGTADVQAVLGINTECDFALTERAVHEAGIGFMVAYRHHGAMRHVGPTRGELGIRTIFNLLGVMSNPAAVKRQLIGVYDPAWMRPMAETLRELGSSHIWVMHGADGLDELTTTGPSQVVEMKDGAISSFEITPEQYGFTRVSLDDIKGGTPQENAAALLAVLKGEAGPYRDITLLNAGAAIMIGGKCSRVEEGIDLARQSIDSGAALNAFETLKRISNEPGAAA